MLVSNPDINCRMLPYLRPTRSALWCLIKRNKLVGTKQPYLLSYRDYPVLNMNVID